MFVYWGGKGSLLHLLKGNKKANKLRQEQTEVCQAKWTRSKIKGDKQKRCLHLRSKSKCGRTRSTIHAWRWRRGWRRGGGFTSSRQNVHLETWCMQTRPRKFKITQQRWCKLKVVVFGESDDDQTCLLGEDWELWFLPQKKQVCCVSAMEYGV